MQTILLTGLRFRTDRVVSQVILFETLYAQSNRSVSFMSHHLQVPLAPTQPCSKAPTAPSGFKLHPARGWYAENGHQHLVGVQGTMTVDACAEACVHSKDRCAAFHVWYSSGCGKGDCYIHTLPLGPFVPGNPQAFTYDREHLPLKTDESEMPLAVVEQGPTVWVQAAADKVRPGDAPPALPTTQATLSAARNEFENVQVVVTGPAAGVSASPAVLTGPGADIPLRLFRAAIVDLTQASGPDGATGKWADALIPARDEFCETRCL